MKVIVKMKTGEVFSNWRINGQPEFADPNKICGQIAFFDEYSVEHTVSQLLSEGHDVYPRELIIK
jgi:hypothetical protein